jgi:hypothetical protein
VRGLDGLALQPTESHEAVVRGDDAARAGRAEVRTRAIDGSDTEHTECLTLVRGRGRARVVRNLGIIVFGGKSVGP